MTKKAERRRSDMKKFGKFLKNLFTKYLGITVLSVILAAAVVIFINMV